MTKVVHVAVAILQNKQGEFLLASRPSDKGWAGWWEFPGGKLETDELPADALSRELQEELAIKPTQLQPWLQRRFDYPQTHDAAAKTVLLHFFFVTEWQGYIEAKEGQTLSWQTPGDVTVSPILPANVPILKALALPDIYAISHIEEMGERQFLAVFKHVLDSGIKLVQLREKHLDKQTLLRLAKKVVAIAQPYQAKVMVNQHIDIAKAAGAHGVHLPSLELMQLRYKPQGLLVSASCHNALELAHAEQLELDFVTLSPITQTKSHPQGQTIGWSAFTEWAATVNIPVYALGGMRPKNLPSALLHGARGIAMQRALWEATP